MPEGHGLLFPGLVCGMNHPHCIHSTISQHTTSPNIWKNILWGFSVHLLILQSCSESHLYLSSGQIGKLSVPITHWSEKAEQLGKGNLLLLYFEALLCLPADISLFRLFQLERKPYSCASSRSRPKRSHDVHDNDI